MANTIVHEEGMYRVIEHYRLACWRCVKGWDEGTLKAPGDGGPKCIHGTGSWQAGYMGPRGKWHGIGPAYGSFNAALAVCQGLALAASIPAQGVPQRNPEA